MSNTYIDVTQERGRSFFGNPPKGEITMLNLLRFRKFADYSNLPDLAPETIISGEEAYQIYMQEVTPILEKVGSELIFMGSTDHFLIGPQDEPWDLVLLVRHESAQEFLKFAQNEEYLKIAGHRTAALADSRLLPLSIPSQVQ